MAQKYWRKSGDGCYVKGSVRGRFCTWQVTPGYEDRVPDYLTPAEVYYYYVSIGALYTKGGGLGDEVDVPKPQEQQGKGKVGDAEGCATVLIVAAFILFLIIDLARKS